MGAFHPCPSRIDGCNGPHVTNDSTCKMCREEHMPKCSAFGCTTRTDRKSGRCFTHDHAGGENFRACSTPECKHVAIAPAVLCLVCSHRERSRGVKPKPATRKPRTPRERVPSPSNVVPVTLEAFMLAGEIVSAAQTLVHALPKCDICDDIALRTHTPGTQALFCDRHAPHPYADAYGPAMRTLVRLIRPTTHTQEEEKKE